MPLYFHFATESDRFCLLGRNCAASDTQLSLEMDGERARHLTAHLQAEADFVSMCAHDKDSISY